MKELELALDDFRSKSISALSPKQALQYGNLLVKAISDLGEGEQSIILKSKGSLEPLFHIYNLCRKKKTSKKRRAEVEKLILSIFGGSTSATATRSGVAITPAVSSSRQFQHRMPPSEHITTAISARQLAEKEFVRLIDEQLSENARKDVSGSKLLSSLKGNDEYDVRWLTDANASSIAETANSIASNTAYRSATLNAFEFLSTLFEHPHFDPSRIMPTVQSIAANTFGAVTYQSFGFLTTLLRTPRFDPSTMMPAVESIASNAGSQTPSALVGLSNLLKWPDFDTVTGPEQFANAVQFISANTSGYGTTYAFNCLSSFIGTNFDPTTGLEQFVKIVQLILANTTAYTLNAFDSLSKLYRNQWFDSSTMMPTVSFIAANTVENATPNVFGCLSSILYESGKSINIPEAFRKESEFISFDANLYSRLSDIVPTRRLARNDAPLLILNCNSITTEFVSFFDSKVMNNKKLLKSRSDRKIAYSFLCDCLEAPVFGKEAQRLLLEADVGADSFIKLARLLSICKALELNLGGVSTRRSSQPTAKLRDELTGLISKEFEKILGMPLPAGMLDSVERLIGPLSTYGTFISFDGELKRIFTASVSAWLNGKFPDYKYSPSFRKEAGEAAYAVWSKDRTLKLESKGAREDAETVRARVRKALLEVKEHFFDSEYLKEDSSLRKTIISAYDDKELMATVTAWCSQHNIKDVDKFISAAGKAAVAWKQLNELIKQSEKPGADIDALNASIIEFAKLVRPVFTVMKAEGAKPQLDVLVGSTSVKTTRVGAYTYNESGSFEELFACGKVEGESPCQAYDYAGEYRQGLVGYIELPWIKVVTIRRPGSEAPEQSVARAMIKLTRNPATNNFQILVEHLYGDGTFLEQIMGNLRAAYEPAGIAVIHVEKKEGVNVRFLSSGD
ncbi:MAG: hypothetical protein WC759_04730, partial [Candidatus Micrarchaeia archaeon]